MILLTIDVGNTHAVFGLFRGKDLLAHFRLQSDINRTVDEFALQILSLLQVSHCASTDVKRVALSCVVPALTRVFTKLSQKYFSVEPLIVGPGVKTGMVIAVDDPRSVGPDRIVNAIAAKALYGTPAVVVDFGTATTFDVVSKQGSYEGGLIAPGLLISAQALFDRAALLPNIELKRPTATIGKNTVESMLAGIIFGYVGLVDGIIERLRREVGSDLKVIATGGLAQLVAEESKCIEQVSPDLTLTGLRLIAEMNA